MKIVEELADEVERLLRINYSPEQISGFLKKEGSDAPSIETIYQYIVRDKKAGGDLYMHLRINGTRRYRRRVKGPRSKIGKRTGIEKRPKPVESRYYFGDWEGSIITGLILTLLKSMTQSMQCQKNRITKVGQRRSQHPDARNGTKK